MSLRAPALDVLLTGGSGQVGSALRRLAPAGWRIEAPTRAELDLADPASIRRTFDRRSWSLVVNAAAYTAVDRAETEVESAWLANALGPAVLAQAAAQAGAPLVHISTDYVFDGAKPEPYLEDDPVRPVGVYGASKEAGEQAVRTGGGRHVILRTAWVVSPHGSNFVRTMLRLADEGGRPLRVVHDQRGNPTSAADLASAVAAVGARLAGDPAAPSGTYHCVNGGEATWFELAQAVLEQAERASGSSAPIEPITTAEYPTAARRPANARLDTAKIRRDYGVALRPWREAVADVVGALQRPREQASQ